MLSTTTFWTEYPPPNEVQSVRSRISHLRDEVQQSREVIKHEEDRIARLEKDIDDQLAIISPIKKIPPEILGYIVELHASIEWWAPALDGSVSRQFRHAVLAYPRAWSYPTLEMKASRRQITRDAAELWMVRAGASPLHVRIDALDDILSRPILMRCPEQIVELKYSGWIKDMRQLCLPNLRRLVLSSNTDASPNPFIGDVDGKHPTPSLDALVLRYLNRVPFTLTPSFPPITTLYLHDVNPGDCWGLVSHCSKTLKNLMLDNCGTLLIPEWTDFPVLEFLSLLRINYFMHFTSTPNLRVFHEGHAAEALCPSLPSVVEYGSLENGPISRSRLAMLQPHFPNLQRLSLRETSKNVAWVLESLVKNPDSWSQLQLLEARVSSDVEVEWFSDMLDQRNSKAKVPITASWIWADDKSKIPLKFACNTDVVL